MPGRLPLLTPTLPTNLKLKAASLMQISFPTGLSWRFLAGHPSTWTDPMVLYPTSIFPFCFEQICAHSSLERVGDSRPLDYRVGFPDNDENPTDGIVT